jgi:hypothetical protein
VNELILIDQEVEGRTYGKSPLILEKEKAP